MRPEPAQLSHAFDGNDRGPRAVDARSHPHEDLGESADLGFAGAVLQHRPALGERRRHHQILGPGDGGQIEEHLGAAQPLRFRLDVSMAQLDLCDEVGNTTLRITSRQGLQLHGVVKHNLKQTIARINEIQLSTLGACGDVNRNVLAWEVGPPPMVVFQVHDYLIAYPSNAVDAGTAHFGVAAVQSVKKSARR